MKAIQKKSQELVTCLNVSVKQQKMSNIPFSTIVWSKIERVSQEGKTGTAFSQTIQFDGLRIRLVEFSAGYLADHWCQKGHIVHCLEGEFITELDNDTEFSMSQGMSFVVSDNLSSHRSISPNGVKLLIIDGDFLQN